MNHLLNDNDDSVEMVVVQLRDRVMLLCEHLKRWEDAKIRDFQNKPGFSF